MTERPILIEEMARKRLKANAEMIDDRFMELGCNSYVKTIYVGYDLDGEMVAALYPYADHVEIALAVPEDFEHPLLIDASHLTWRTLPLAAVVRIKSDAKQMLPLIDAACRSVKEGSHNVHRENDYFVRSRKERRSQR